MTFTRLASHAIVAMSDGLSAHSYMQKSTKSRKSQPKPQPKPSEKLRGIVDQLNDFESVHSCLDIRGEDTEFFQAAALLEEFAESLEHEGL